MWQEIAVGIIGIGVVCFVVRKIYKLYTSSKCNNTCCGCSGCSLKKRE